VWEAFFNRWSFLLWHNETKILERELSIAQAESVLSENQENTAGEKQETSTENQGGKTTTVFNWGIRIAGWIILFLGLATLFRPLVVLVDKIPLLGNFVGRGITVFAFSELIESLIHSCLCRLDGITACVWGNHAAGWCGAAFRAVSHWETRPVETGTQESLSSKSEPFQEL